MGVSNVRPNVTAGCNTHTQGSGLSGRLNQWFNTSCLRHRRIMDSELSRALTPHFVRRGKEFRLRGIQENHDHGESRTGISD